MTQQVEYTEQWCRWGCRRETIHRVLLIPTLTKRHIMCIVRCERCLKQEGRMV